MKILDILGSKLSSIDVRSSGVTLWVVTFNLKTSVENFKLSLSSNLEMLWQKLVLSKLIGPPANWCSDVFVFCMIVCNNKRCNPLASHFLPDSSAENCITLLTVLLKVSWCKCKTVVPKP